MKFKAFLKGLRSKDLYFIFFLFYPINSQAQVTVKQFTTVGKEQWTVPACVSSLSLDINGADGGDADERGGGGQTIIATFPVSPGDVLEIVVGESGIGTIGQAASGGGGSGVLNTTTNTLLVIAGGGGGGQGESDPLGVGKGGSGVLSSIHTSCIGFDNPGCGGSLFDSSGSGEGGGGGGGYLGIGQELIGIGGSGISGFGGLAGFGVVGGLGAGSAPSLIGGYGAGGGGGSSGLCAGGGGGGGYTGGQGGSRNPGLNGGGWGGTGFVNGVVYSETPGIAGGGLNRNGRVQLSYMVNTPPAVSAAASVNNTLITLTSTFVASLTSTHVTNWTWTGPNGFSSLQKDPPSFTANAAGVGTYTVTVTDNNGCTNTASTAIILPTAQKEIQNIPTMSQWGLLIYGLLILNLSLFFIPSFVGIEREED